MNNINHRRSKILQLLLLWFFFISVKTFANNEINQYMALIPAGSFVPLYSTTAVNKNNKKIEKKRIFVKKFYLDIVPVTDDDYLKFVKQNQDWKKSNIKKIFAEGSYLIHWQGDLIIDNGPVHKTPVVNVSWFAANAYCQWQGKRLPTVAEWEYVANASETKTDASKDKKFTEKILKWYSRPNTEKLPEVGSIYKNIFGVYDMHGLVWEWTYDFNTVLVTGESRADSALERKLFCGSGAIGAANMEDYAAFMRYAFRSSLKGNFTTHNLGFRCAKDFNKRTVTNE